jgi:hypothetical protein
MCGPAGGSWQDRAAHVHSAQRRRSGGSERASLSRSGATPDCRLSRQSSRGVTPRASTAELQVASIPVARRAEDILWNVFKC